MRKVLLLLVALTVFCLFTPLSMAEKGGNKPGGGGGGHDGGGGGKVSTQICDMTGDVAGSDVEVGIDVGTYGPDIDLDLSENVLLGYLDPPPETPYRGEARVLKERVQSSLYFYFRMDGTDGCEAPEGSEIYASGCDALLILTGGTYNRKTQTVLFGEGSNLYLFDLTLSPPRLFWGEPGEDTPRAFGGSVVINNFADPTP